MADAIKISDLPDASSFGTEDFIIVNDITNSVEVTSKISVGGLVNWITEQELVFIKPIEVNEIVPGENGLNITVNGIQIIDDITIDPYAVIQGIELDDLDDVDIDKQLLQHGHTLMWDSSTSAWVNDFLSGDNAGDTVKTDFDLLRDSIDTLNDSIDTLNDSIDTLNDSIELLMDSIDAKVDPAPSDGGYYAMQNGEWVDISESVNKFTKYLIYDGGVDPT